MKKGTQNKQASGRRKPVRCAEDGCYLESRGYEIERAYDKENQPVYAVFYECPEGHKFIAEYERDPDEFLEESRLVYA
jgi:hypothetical protein